MHYVIFVLLLIFVLAMHFVFFSPLLSHIAFFIPYHSLSISPRRPFHLPPPSTHSTDMSLGFVRGNIAACVSFFIFATCSGIPTNF